MRSALANLLTTIISSTISPTDSEPDEESASEDAIDHRVSPGRTVISTNRLAECAETIELFIELFEASDWPEPDALARAEKPAPTTTRPDTTAVRKTLRFMGKSLST